MFVVSPPLLGMPLLELFVSSYIRNMQAYGSAVPPGTFSRVWLYVAIGFVLLFGGWALWQINGQACRIKSRHTPTPCDMPPPCPTKRPECKRSASDPSAELDWVGGPVQAP